MSKVQALKVVTEKVVGCQSYKLPSCCENLSKDVPEDLLQKTMLLTQTGSFPQKPKNDESEIPHRTNLAPTQIYLSGIQSNLARPGQPCVEHGLPPNWMIPSSAVCGLESQIWDRLTTQRGRLPE